MATIGTLITGILFFAVDERWGTINDMVSIFQVVLMLPVAAAMDLLTRPGGGGLALPALALGSIGMVIAAVLQTLLVLRMVTFESTIGAVLSAGAGIGLWLVLVNVLACMGGVLSWGLGGFGIAAGVGYLLVAVGFHRGGQEHPLFYAGTALVVAGYAVWATRLGHLLLIGALATGAVF